MVCIQSTKYNIGPGDSPHRWIDWLWSSGLFCLRARGFPTLDDIVRLYQHRQLLLYDFFSPRELKLTRVVKSQNQRSLHSPHHTISEHSYKTLHLQQTIPTKLHKQKHRDSPGGTIVFPNPALKQQPLQRCSPFHPSPRATYVPGSSDSNFSNSPGED